MPTIDHELISRLAYQLWLDRGQPLGSPEIDWNLAVKLSTQQRSPIADLSSIAPDNGGLRLASDSTEVPMEVPPTTPGLPDIPPTKAATRRITQPKATLRLSKA